MDATDPAALADPPLTHPAPDSGQPWRAGLQAARANLIPGLALQAAMIAIIYAYYGVPSARPWFDRLAVLKLHAGWKFTVIATVVAGALLPEILRVCWLERGRPWSRIATDFAFGICLWAFAGYLIELFYWWQSIWFGTAVSALVTAKKVVVDQFIYNPVWAAPYSVIAYEWKNGGFVFARLLRQLGERGYYGRRILPTLIANWGVWIPCLCVIYSLPFLLQTPLFAVALSFWALMLAYMNSARPAIDRHPPTGGRGDLLPL